MCKNSIFFWRSHPWTCSLDGNPVNMFNCVPFCHSSFTCMHAHTETQTHFVLHSQSTVNHTQCWTHSGTSAISWLIVLKIYGNLCGRCLFRIPPRTVPVMTEVWHGSQFLDANASVVAPLAHGFFLQNPF
jgi:hypothetical protein